MERMIQQQNRNKAIAERRRLRELQAKMMEGIPQYGENPDNKPQKSKKELEKYPDRDIFRRWTFPGVNYRYLLTQHYKLWHFVANLPHHVVAPDKNAKTIQRYWRAYKNGSTVDPLRRMFLAYRKQKIEKTSWEGKLLLPWK